MDIELNVHKLCIESDSDIFVNILGNGTNAFHPLEAVSSSCHHLLSQFECAIGCGMFSQEQCCDF